MRKNLTILLSLLLLPPLILSLWAFALPPQYSESFMGELPGKVRLLSETEGPRIILLGGSAVAFGVDSTCLQEQLPGWRTVNFGMYAALGTTVMLELSKNLIRPGDLVVLLPEQSRQTLSDFFDPDVFWQGADGATELLLPLSPGHLLQLLGAFPYFAARKFQAFLHPSSPSDSVYVRSSFNERGDLTAAVCQSNIMEDGWDITSPVSFSPDVLDPSFVQAVNAYARQIRSVGAECVYMFCPINARAVTGEEGAADFYEVLLDQLDMDLIGDPSESIMDAEWFYDTNFHLNAAGRQVYTRLLAENLKAWLGDSSPVSIPVPEKPEMHVLPAQTDGNSSDEAFFLYEDTEQGFAVAGLTETGRLQARLTVPAMHLGRPVTRLLTGALTGAAVEEIVVQESLRSMQDGAFSGAERLRRIRLLSESPSACAVGQGLLDGTEALLYVPLSSLAKYRTDYFWSVYGARIRPDTEP